MAKMWSGEVPKTDSFGRRILESEGFVDGRTLTGQWALMNRQSYAEHGVGLGTGLGQRYFKTAKGWEKVEG